MSESMGSKNEKRRLAPGDIVTPKELSQMLRLSLATIRNLASAGELPGFKIGDSWRFDLGKIRQWFRRGWPSAQDG